MFAYTSAYLHLTHSISMQCVASQDCYTESFHSRHYHTSQYNRGLFPIFLIHILNLVSQDQLTRFNVSCSTYKRCILGQLIWLHLPTDFCYSSPLIDFSQLLHTVAKYLTRRTHRYSDRLCREQTQTWCKHHFW